MVNTPLYNITVNIAVSIPIIGDESIMLLRPPENFVFRKIYLEDYEHKDRITDSRGEVLSEYIGAIHRDEKPYFICLEQNSTRVVQYDKPVNSLAFLNGTDFDDLIEPIHADIRSQIFWYFSLIHLFKEGEIARKNMFCNYSAHEGICKIHRTINSYIESTVTLIRYPMVIQHDEIADMNDLIFNHEPACRMLKPIVIDELEQTYHTTDDVTNYKNIITPLEVLFLQNDYGNKKEMLSKRIAVFLGCSDSEMKSIYDDIKVHYRDRSDAVHEGSTVNITRSTLNELRRILRMVIMKYIDTIEQELASNPNANFDEIKTSLIAQLKIIVQSKNDLNIW